jgi:intracellular multiplication protein IcmL
MPKTSSNSSAAPEEKQSRSLRVRTRNEAVYLIYRRLIGVAILALVCAGISCVAMMGVIGKPVPPQYIPVTQTGSLIPEIPLNKPNKSRGEIGQYALEAIRAINTYDYINWRDQFAQAQTYFSTSGWNSYAESFKNARTLDALTNRKMISSIEPKGEMQFREGVAKNGRYAWRIEIPVEIMLTAHALTPNGAVDSGNRLTGTITLTISRMTNSENPEGVAIQLYQWSQER